MKKISMICVLMVLAFTVISFSSPVHEYGLDTDEVLIPNDSIQPKHSPVPEPATMLLFGSGLIGLSFISRKGKNKSINN